MAAPSPAGAGNPGILAALTTRRQWLREPMVLITAGLLTAAITAGLVLYLAQPSYPHPWCGPLISRLQDKTGTQDSFEADLARIQRQDHAPIGKLAADIFRYDVAYYAVQDTSIPNAPAAFASEKQALAVVSADLKALNRACGQPPDAYKRDAI